MKNGKNSGLMKKKIGRIEDSRQIWLRISSLNIISIKVEQKFMIYLQHQFYQSYCSRQHPVIMIIPFLNKAVTYKHLIPRQFESVLNVKQIRKLRHHLLFRYDYSKEVGNRG